MEISNFSMIEVALSLDAEELYNISRVISCAFAVSMANNGCVMGKLKGRIYPGKFAQHPRTSQSI